MWGCSAACVTPALPAGSSIRARVLVVPWSMAAMLMSRILGKGKGEAVARDPVDDAGERSEEHTSELQSLMRISYAVFCLKKKKQKTDVTIIYTTTSTVRSTQTSQL